MQLDLQGLEISLGELRHLTGVDSSEVFRPSILKTSKIRFSFLLNEALISLALTPILVGLLHVFVILPTIGSSIPATIGSIIMVPVCVIAVRWLWLKYKSPIALCSLLDEVDKYNTVIQAIHINDQLEAVGTPEMSVTDRKKVIEALRLTREDLVRALRSEKILRENQSFIAGNPELFATNLRAVQALQVSDRASEYGRLLNEALQIAVGVQEEMRKLQNQRSSEK